MQHVIGAGAEDCARSGAGMAGRVGVPEHHRRGHDLWTREPGADGAERLGRASRFAGFRRTVSRAAPARGVAHATGVRVRFMVTTHSQIEGLARRRQSASPPGRAGAARRLRLDSVRGRARLLEELWHASRASAGPWGGARDGRAGALNREVTIPARRPGQASTKRQPAGTASSIVVRTNGATMEDRWHGAFGSIACGRDARVLHEVWCASRCFGSVLRRAPSC